MPAALGVLPSGEDRTPLQRRDDVLVYTSIHHSREYPSRIILPVRARRRATE